ncbi:MAG: DUF4184 family protein [Massilia sp.]
MPFTVSHIAAVLPLGRWSRYRLPLSALAIGSMAPDFGYFLNLGLPSRMSHTVEGVLTQCAPLALLVYLIFHLLLSRPVLAMLPQALADRLAPSLPGRADLTFGNMLAVLAALVIGGLTHIWWDGATHRDGAIVMAFPILLSPVPLPFWPDLLLYKLLQHVSSVFGLAVLALALRAWMRRPEKPSPRLPAYPVLAAQLRNGVLLAIVALGVLGAWTGWHTVSDWARLERCLFFAVVGGIKMMLGASLLYCLAWQACGLFGRRTVTSK